MNLIADDFARRCDLFLRGGCIVLAGWRDDGSRRLILRNTARSLAGTYLVCAPVASERRFLAFLASGLELTPQGQTTADLHRCISSYVDTDPPALFLDDAEHLRPESVKSLVQLHKQHEHAGRKWPMVLASGQEDFFKKIEEVCEDSYVLGHCAYFNPEHFPTPRNAALQEAIAQMTDDMEHPILRIPTAPRCRGDKPKH